MPYRVALGDTLRAMAENRSAGREKERELAICLLSMRLTSARTEPTSAPAYVSFIDQNELLESLRDFDWDGLGTTVLDLFRRSVREKVTTVGGQIERDDLAYTCATRLLHRGYDAEFKAFFSAELLELRREDANALQTQGSLPRGYAGYHPALVQRIERFEEFVRSCGE